MSDTPLVWFNEARSRWIGVCPLRRCDWHTGSSDRVQVDRVASLHTVVCPGRAR